MRNGAPTANGGSPFRPADRTPELSVSGFVVIASCLVFGALLLAVPPFFLSFDEAKYIGIGYNVLDGLGPRTPFGDYHLLHAPVWATVLVLPETWLGIAPLDTGHALNAIAGIGLVLLAGILGWRIRPAVGAIAATGVVGVTYVHDLTRTARLDLPAAFLVVLFLVVGLDAFRRGGVPRAVLAGALFAIAFLVKEIALPLAPVPVAAGILAGRPWRALAVSAGWMTGIAAVGVSWWFLFVADVSGVVYRLGTPAWTLGPIGAAIAGVALLGIFAERIPTSRRIDAFSQRLGLETGGRGRVVLVGALTAAWCVTLLSVFSGALEKLGTDLLDPAQIRRYASTWLRGGLAIVAAAGALGVLLSIPAWRAAPARGRRALIELWLAVICSVPLLVLVIGLGEPPRNYLAQVAMLAALSGAGWLWLGETIVGALRWPEHRPRLAAAAMPASLLALLVASSGVLAQHALTFRETRTGVARAAAITTSVDWVRANVPNGSTVAIGSFLSYEISLGLRGTHRTTQVRHVLTIADPVAPRGVRIFDAAATDDWIALDIAPRNINEFQGFAAERLGAMLQDRGVEVWIYATEGPTSAPTVIHALAETTGIEELARWSWPSGTIPLDVHVYGIDPDRLAFDTDRIHVSTEALERLVVMLEDAGPAGAATAANLADRVVISPPSPSAEPLMARLRAAAGQ